MENVKLLESSILKRDLTTLRDKNSSSVVFSTALRRIALILAVESGSVLDTVSTVVDTPLEKTDGYKLRTNPVLLPVLRAGLGMLEGFREIYPDSPVGMIGTKRNEATLAAENYYINIPKSAEGNIVFLLDPMLATGGTGIHAIETLKKMGFNAIIYFSVISAPEGINNVQKAHPSVKIITCAIDRELNSNGYIMPGLGDAGDRYFST